MNDFVISYYNVIPKLNISLFEKFYFIMILWRKNKISIKAKSKINFYKKKFKIDFQYVLDYDLKKKHFYLYEFYYSHKIAGCVHFIVNQNNTQIICLHRCRFCHVKVDEENINYGDRYTLKFRDYKTRFILDDICSKCINYFISYNVQIKNILSSNKKILFNILNIYFNNKHAKYFTILIYDYYVLGYDLIKKI